MERKEPNEKKITAELIRLAREITARDYHAALVTPDTKRPSLSVATRRCRSAHRSSRCPGSAVPGGPAEAGDGPRA
jgi:hypothetical protein